MREKILAARLHKDAFCETPQFMGVEALLAIACHCLPKCKYYSQKTYNKRLAQLACASMAEMGASAP